MTSSSPTTSRSSGSGLLWAALCLAALLAPGCQHVLFHTQSRVTDVDFKDEKRLNRRAVVTFRLGENGTTNRLVFALEDVEEFSGFKREHRQPWGVYVPFDPIQKTVELLAFPWVLGSGAWEGLVWIFGDKDAGSLGEGGVGSPPAGFPEGNFDFEERGRCVDFFAGKPDWPDWAGQVMNPLECSRFFRFTEEGVNLGPVGAPEPGPWRPHRRTRPAKNPRSGTLVRAEMDGVNLLERVNTASHGPGGTRESSLSLSDLAGALSSDKGILTVEYEIAAGVRVTGKETVIAESLNALLRVSEIDEALLSQPDDRSLLIEAATLLARWGSIEQGAIRLRQGLGVMGEEGPKDGDEEAILSFYGQLDDRFARNPKTRYWIRTLRDHHLAIRLEKCKGWPTWEKKLKPLLYEYVASSSMVKRAQGIVTLALRKDLMSPRHRNALLIGLLGAERHKLVIWSILWALATSPWPDGQETLEYYVARERDQLLKAQAQASLVRISEDE